jgi:hypothetical protein
VPAGDSVICHRIVRYMLVLSGNKGMLAPYSSVKCYGWSGRWKPYLAVLLEVLDFPAGEDRGVAQLGEDGPHVPAGQLHISNQEHKAWSPLRKISK